MRKTSPRLLLIILFIFSNLSNAETLPTVDIPKKISGSQVIILSKQGDALSQKIARYYAQQRHVPNDQIVSISLPANTNTLSSKQFSSLFSVLHDVFVSFALEPLLLLLLFINGNDKIPSD